MTAIINFISNAANLFATEPAIESSKPSSFSRSQIIFQSCRAGMLWWAPFATQHLPQIVYAANGAAGMFAETAFHAAHGAIGALEAEQAKVLLAEIAQDVDAQAKKNPSLSEIANSIHTTVPALTARRATAVYLLPCLQKIKEWTANKITLTSGLGGAFAITRRVAAMVQVGEKSNPNAIAAAKITTAFWYAHQVYSSYRNALRKPNPENVSRMSRLITVLRRNFLPAELTCRGLETGSFLFKTVGMGILLSGIAAGIVGAFTDPKAFAATYNQVHAKEAKQKQKDETTLLNPNPSFEQQLADLTKKTRKEQEKIDQVSNLIANSPVS